MTRHQDFRPMASPKALPDGQSHPDQTAAVASNNNPVEGSEAHPLKDQSFKSMTPGTEPSGATNQVREQDQVLIKARERFCQKLISMREEAGLTKIGLVQATRISMPFIEALENGRFDALPGDAFGRGFVRNICVALNSDPTELIALFNQCRSSQDRAAERPYESRQAANFDRMQRYLRGFRLVLMGGLGMLVVFLASHLWLESAGQFGGRQHPQEQPAVEQDFQTQNGPPKPMLDDSNPSDPNLTREEATSSPSRPLTEVTRRSLSAKPRSTALMAKSDGSYEVFTKESTFEQNLHIDANRQVQITVAIDEGKNASRLLEPGLHHLSFKHDAQLKIASPDAVAISLNGTPVGLEAVTSTPLRLSFKALSTLGAPL